jgi:hypothetical protein
MGKSAEKKTICQVEGCGDKVLAKNYCCKHYYQYKRHGCISNTPRRKKIHCMVDNCDRPHYSRGYCSRHYQQLLKKNSLLRDSPKRSSKIICYAPTCKGTVFASGYCRLHYIKMKSLELLAEAHPEWVVLNNKNNTSTADTGISEPIRSERKNSYDDNLKEAFALIDSQ